MILTYTDIFKDGEVCRIKAEITTDHPASSYGQPVLVLPDGQTLNAESWVLLDYHVVKASKSEAVMMEKWLKNLYAMMGITESPAVSLGRKGGQAKSPAKTAAVRENAKKSHGAPWQNWIAGDEPENCIPIGEDTKEDHPGEGKVVRARSAEEACKKGIELYNKTIKRG